MNIIQEFQDFRNLNESEIYDSEKLYSYDAIVKRIKSGAGYMQQYISKLPKIPCTNLVGEPMICTKIPEIIFNFIYNRNF